MKKDIARINSLKELIRSKKLDALCFFHPEDVLMSTGMLPAAPFTVSSINKGGRITIICLSLPKILSGLLYKELRILTGDKLILSKVGCRLAEGPISCRERIGGLLKSYHRDAA